MMGLEGKCLSKKEKAFIRKYDPSGFIYFRRNVDTPAQLRKFSQQLCTLSETAPLIGIDQEGGRVCRLYAPFTEWPGNRSLGKIFRKTGKETLARKQAVAMARELKAIGVNVNFTPVADVDSNARNPVIGDRSFDSRPSIVSRLVSATVRAYNRERVVSCAKHFPGHGDASSDSHLVLPVIEVSRRQMGRRELEPFRAAIRAQVPTIMTAHVVYPTWDKNPATLSSVLIQGLLREKMGFQGVVLSDDLEMKAISQHGEIAEAAIKALSAGVDLLLVCKSLDEAEKVIRRIEQALKRNEISEERVNEALGRVRALKKKYLSKPGREGNLALSDGWPEHQKLARVIEKEA